MFLLSLEEISRSALSNSSAGGFICFEGRVRDHNNGKHVIRLEYEAFEPLALSEGHLILKEARERFKILNIEAVHRIGSLSIGEVAVWIGVTAEHREAAFAACQYAIDEIKTRLPIWKKETYLDGTGKWVGCHHSADPRSVDSTLSPDELDYYSRQITLPEIGRSGQATLKQAKVLIVGSGGLGSPALMYLARAGVGTLGICEFDWVAADNLPRQILYGHSDIGKLKGKQAQDRLAQANPYVQIRCHPEWFGPENAQMLLSQYDVVLDCTDNRETHLLLSRMAVKSRKILIQAGIYQYEGQLAVYNPHDGSPCLCSLWDMPQQVDGTCEVNGVLNTTPGVLGLMQATEAIKALLDIPSPLNDHLLLMDLMNYKILPIRRLPGQDCPACRESYSQNPIEKPKREDFPIICLENMRDLKQYAVVHMGGKDPGWLTMAGHWQTWDEAWQPERATQMKYLLVCPFGRRSLHLARAFRERGFQNVFSLEGGISAFYKLSAGERF